MIIQPTAPMRSAAVIDEAIKNVILHQCDSLVSLYQVEDCHPSRMYIIDDGVMTKVMEEPAGALRQALPAIYHRNGCIYLSSRELLLEKSLIVGDTCFPYIMPASRSVNIDTELDLEYAEFIFQRNLKK
jgi:CMP-N-acetylneuraminic acid synthetase